MVDAIRWLPTRLLAVLALLLAGPALAHKLQVFASANGALIEGQAYFAGGQPASGAQVLILDADGEQLAVLTPDAQGRFQYRATAPVDHRVIAAGADGHRAGWQVSAEELAPGFPGAEVPATGTGPGTGPGRPASPPAARPSPVAAQGTEASPLPEDLTAAIERAVARQVRPLREELAAAQGQVALRDVLGGIGYIFGLAGLALWWKHGRRAGRDQDGPPRR